MMLYLVVSSFFVPLEYEKDEIIALLQQQNSFLQEQICSLQSQLAASNRKADALLEEVTSLRNTLEHKSEEEARQKRIIKGLVKISENKSEKQAPAPASQDTPADRSSEKRNAPVPTTAQGASNTLRRKS